MRTSAVIFGLIASVMAIPTALQSRQSTANLCAGATNTPLCCDVDVLGVADLDCTTPPTIPTSVADFTNICASIGKIDRCCLLPILEQGIICAAPV